MMDEQSARNFLQDLFLQIRECIAQGFSDKLKLYADCQHEHSKITRPLLIRDHIIARVKKQYENHPRIDIREHGNMFLMVVDWAVVIKFNKMDEHLNTCNNFKNKSKEYIQETIFDGTLENASFFHAGYIPSELWTEINGIFVTCYNESSLEWHINLDDYTEATLNTEITTITPEIEQRARKRVHAIRSAKGEESHEEGTGS